MTAIILTQCSKGPQWVATFCHWFIQNIDTTPISHSRWKLLNLFLHMEKIFSFLSFSPLLLYLCSSQSMGNTISNTLMANILHSGRNSEFYGNISYSKTKSISSLMYHCMKVLNFCTIDMLKSLSFHDTCTYDLT